MRIPTASHPVTFLTSTTNETLLKKAIQMISNYKSDRVLSILTSFLSKEFDDTVKRRVEYSIRKIEEYKANAE